MNILGVNALGQHEPAACLVRDGAVVAAVEEERFSRQKHGIGQRPYRSVSFCLREAGLTLDDVDHVASPWMATDDTYADGPVDPARSFGVDAGEDDALPTPLAALFADARRRGQWVPPVTRVSHHLAHAASAFRCSGFEDSAILVVDGEGDGVSTSVAYGRDGVITPVAQFPATQSLGHFYAAATLYLGFGNFGDGKCMGLAAYGRAPDASAFVLEPDGYRGAIPLASHHPGRRWRDVRAQWEAYFCARFGPPLRPVWAQLGPGDAEFRRGADVAAFAQASLERVLLHLAEIAVRASGSRRLVVAGGVGLNCSANGAIAAGGIAEEVFVQPLASDCGVAIGAALELGARVAGWKPKRMADAFFGPRYGDAEVASLCEEVGLGYRCLDDPAATTVELIGRDLVVGFFQGRAENGPRALGHRSILARPDRVAVRDRVNRIKHRELWRPLAPSLAAEHAARIVGRRVERPFMIVRDFAEGPDADAVPAVVHVDRSLRPHTVERAVDPLYWEVVSGFERASGLPCIVNTSFNNESEPVVDSPRDAIRTFYSSGLDALVIGGLLLAKPKIAI